MRKISDRAYLEGFHSGGKQNKKTSIKQKALDDREFSEEAFVEAFDQKDLILQYAKEIDQLRKGKIEMQEFLQTLSIPAVLTIVQSMNDANSPKDKAAIAGDILDRAGHGKINKVAMATKNFDKSTAKEELISHIMGFAADSDVVKVK